MRKIDSIYVHCSYTPVSMDIGAAEIKQWHTDPKPAGNGWSDIGYHFVLRRGGAVEKGRLISRPGAHARGHNQHSIGICLVGGKKGRKAEFNFTIYQMEALQDIVYAMIDKYGLTPADVHGHNEVSQKLCPCFDVQAYFSE